jgi:hypothetical protein
MNNTLTKIAIGFVTIVSGGAYVPIIPSNLEAGLSGLPDMRGYQYEVGSDRTIYKDVDGEFVANGMSPDADFEDDDKNGLISVAVYTDRKGQDVYKKITDAEYAKMGEENGALHNPKKTELISIFDSITPKAEAAIAIDATSQGYANATSLTFSHTTTGSDRLLMVQLWTFPSGDTVSGITYNSTSLTKKGTRSADAGGYTNQWSLVAPATGANNIVVSMSSSQMFVTAASYTGVDQTTPHPDATVTGSLAGTALSISTTDVTVDQSWLVMAGRSPSRIPSASAGTFQRKLNGTSGDAGWTLDSDGGRSTGANTLDFTYAPSQTTYYVMTNIAPASGGGGGSSSTPQLPEDIMYYQ